MPEPNPDRGGQSRLRQSAPLVVSAIALALAAGGIGVGAGALITGADIKNGSITGADIKNGSIAGDDIKPGSIQVSDLSKGAMNGLDGKDGEDGKQGPAGPAGPAGPRGVAGSSGSGGGGITIRDANGDVVSDVTPVPVPYLNVANGRVDGFWRKVDGRIWHVSGITGVATAGSNFTDGVAFYLTNDCSGPLYVEDVANTSPNYLPVGSFFGARYGAMPAFTVSNTSVSYTSMDPLSGYHEAIGNGTQCINNVNLGNQGPRNRNFVAHQLTPVSPPSPLSAPFTFE